jgi:hypothetical protein
MFQLNREEWVTLRSQSVILDSAGHGGRRCAPFAVRLYRARRGDAFENESTPVPFDWIDLPTPARKCHKHHVAMQAVFFAWYNLCRKHEAIQGQTPAMAAGITSKIWSVPELLERAAKA